MVICARAQHAKGLVYSTDRMPTGEFQFFAPVDDDGSSCSPSGRRSVLPLGAVDASDRKSIRSDAVSLLGVTSDVLVAVAASACLLVDAMAVCACEIDGVDGIG